MVTKSRYFINTRRLSSLIWERNQSKKRRIDGIGWKITLPDGLERWGVTVSREEAGSGRGAVWCVDEGIRADVLNKWAFLLAGLNIWFGPTKILGRPDSKSAQ